MPPPPAPRRSLPAPPPPTETPDVAPPPLPAFPVRWQRALPMSGRRREPAAAVAGLKATTRRAAW